MQSRFPQLPTRGLKLFFRDMAGESHFKFKLYFNFFYFILINILCIKTSYAFQDLTLFPIDFDKLRPPSPLVLINQDQAESKIVNSIIFKGNIRTSDDLINDNIMLKVGLPFNKLLFDETLKNLKNLEVFSKIKIDIFENHQKKLDIKIEIIEKWTLLPYVIVGSGGGSSYYALGLYDTNFLGMLYTFNFTYGCKNNNCSWVTFFRNPHSFGKKISFVISPAQYHNLYYIYNKKREVIGTFSNTQDLLFSYADFQIKPGISLGGGVIYQNNLITSTGLNTNENENNVRNNYMLPPSTNSTALEGRLSLGQINYDGLVIDGVSFVSILDSTLEAYSPRVNNFTAINNTVLFYQPFSLLRYAYFAFRANISTTTSSVSSQHYFVGGLDKIRGFFDGEYSGSYAWFSNAELRIPSYVGDIVALQHVVFADTGFATDSFASVFGSDNAVSIGTGVRLLFLNVNKIALRVDCAYTLNPFQTYGFSLGLLQFF